jgi:hypothetical protein
MECCRVGCFDRAEYQVYVLLKAPGDYGYPPLRMMIGNFCVCEKHKADVKVESVVNEQGWGMLCELFRRSGTVEPERALCQVEFEELEPLEV